MGSEKPQAGQPPRGQVGFGKARKWLLGGRFWGIKPHWHPRLEERAGPGSNQASGQTLLCRWAVQTNTGEEPLIGFQPCPPPFQLQGMLALRATSPLPGLLQKEGVIVLGRGISR